MVLKPIKVLSVEMYVNGLLFFMLAVILVSDSTVQ